MALKVKNMDNILQLNEFFVEGGNQEKSHVLLHITEPSTPEEEEKGYFFAICEIASADNQQILRIQSVIDEIEQQYYESDKIISGKHPLEKVLEKINQGNHPLIKQIGTQLNCVVGVISKPEIVFSFHGRPQILLFYKNREGYYQKMDLAEANPEENEEKQIFSQIVQGKISPSDFLFLSTPRVLDYFTPDRLQKIIISRPPRQSAEHLEKVLAELRNSYSYGGLIVHLENTDKNIADKKQRPLKNSGSVRSLDRLYVTEQNTASTLAPSMLNKVNKKIQSFVKQTPHFIDKIEETPEKEIKKIIPAQISSAHLRPHIPLNGPRPDGIDYRHLLANALRISWQVMKYLVQGIIWLMMLIWGIILALFKLITTLFFIATNIGNRRRAILAAWTQNWRNYKEYFRNLPLLTKILFSTSIILVVIFIISISCISFQKQKAAKEKLFSDQINIIKEAKDSADSYLIYNNEAQATEQIQLAEKTLAATDCLPALHAKLCEELTQQINQLSLKIRKEYQTTPELIYDWSASGQTIIGLTRINNKIIAYSNNNSDLLIFDLLTKTSSQIKTDGTITSFSAAAVPKENDYALFVFNKNHLLQYNPDDNSSKIIDISYPKETVDLAGLVIYNRKLYALDRNNGQIYKHDNIKGGFAEGKIWIKDGSKISAGQDITIDGDVYVLNKTGVIEKFNAGEKQDFSPLVIEPTLTNADQIWTYTDLRYVYVLDSQGKRLLILDKNGQLIKQLTNTIFSALHGMSVDEASQTAYILEQNKLYKINL